MLKSYSQFIFSGASKRCMRKLRVSQLTEKELYPFIHCIAEKELYPFIHCITFPICTIRPTNFEALCPAKSVGKALEIAETFLGARAQWGFEATLSRYK